MAEILVGNVVPIASIVLQIKEVADKVRRNKKDCSEIAKFVARNCALFKCLEEETNIKKNEAISKTLEDVTENLNEALMLVTECQNKNFLSRFFRAGDMATDLSRVRANLVENIMQASLAINIHGTILLTNQFHDAMAAPRLQPQVSFHQVPSCPLARHQVTGSPSGEGSSEAQNAGVVNISMGGDSAGDARLDTVSQLKVATNNFSNANTFGEGNSSSIYKGVLGEGLVVVAIKEFHPRFNTEPLITNEFNIHMKVHQHKNVAKLVGYCMEVQKIFYCVKNGQCIFADYPRNFLVLQYIPNGHLGTIIQGTTRPDWSSCFQIVKGIVEGVHYLHQQRVVHMDLKPENILLDSDLNPVIIDFGISILLDHFADEVILDSTVGTVGYIPPEQLDKGKVSTKSDTYGFGITLRKTITGVCTGSEEHWQTMLRDAGGVAGSLDPTLQVDESQLTEIKRCEVVALLCTEYDPRDRPTMAEVLQMLNGEEELPTLKKPYL